jgi:hypothetical protein
VSGKLCGLCVYEINIGGRPSISEITVCARFLVVILFLSLCVSFLVCVGDAFFMGFLLFLACIFVLLTFYFQARF